MKLIAQRDDRRFWFLRLEPPYNTPFPGFGMPFVAVVVACDPLLTPEQQAEISSQLVAKDCRYMLAWGINASSWDDSVDWALLATDTNFDPPCDRLVMTTWHDNEPIRDVIRFALQNTNFDSHNFHNFLALVIGTNPHIEAELVATIKGQFATR